MNSWFVYGQTESPRLPAAGDRGVQIHREARRAGDDDRSGLVIDGGHGLFLTGASHFLYLAPSRIVFDERIRLAKDTLLVERGPVTLRIEGELTLDEAVKIARSFH